MTKTNCYIKIIFQSKKYIEYSRGEKKSPKRMAYIRAKTYTHIHYTLVFWPNRPIFIAGLI